MAGRFKVSTIQRRLSAISQAHIAAGHPSPVQNPQVRELMNGIKRSKGTAPAKKTALLMKDIRAMVNQLPSNRLGIRDRALLLLGFAGAFRRSELTALDVEDLEFNEDGMIVRVRRSKTDAEGRGEKVGIPYGSNPATCPVRSLWSWLEASGLESGALFRGINRHGRIQADRLTSQSIAKIVKRYAEAAGLKPELYGAHSLRSGFATQADLAGAKFTDIKRQGRWKNDATVRGYMPRSELFESNAEAEPGL